MMKRHLRATLLVSLIYAENGPLSLMMILRREDLSKLSLDR